MNILFRYQTNAEIGIGHLVRSSSLAHIFESNQVWAVSENHSFTDAFMKNLKVMKVSIEKTALRDEAIKIAQIVNQNAIDWIVLDGYIFDMDYQIILKDSTTANILSIDDIANVSFCSHLVLNQNSHATKEMYQGKTSKETKLLLGPSYALLRPQFQQNFNYQRKFSEVKNILVTLGGGDFQNQTMKVLKALWGLNLSAAITVIIGPTNPHEKEIGQFTKSNPKIQILKNPENLRDLMLNSDLAVSASGSTSWELCRTGVPTLQIILSDNQRGVAESLEKLEISENLGWYEKASEELIREKVNQLLNDAPKRESMSVKARKLVDGQGANRVYKEIESCKILQK